MRKRAHPSQKQRIAFVINSMEGGGAERVLSILLDQLVQQFAEAEVYLILLDQKVERYETPAYIKKTTLDCQGSMIKSILSLRQELRKIAPDIVLSFLNRANCANIIAARTLGYHCIVSERVNTSSHFGAGISGWINKIIVRALYPMADQVLAVSKGVGNDLQLNFGVPQQRIEVIYNPYDLDRLAALAAQPPSLQIAGDYIVSVGRLVPNKNFPLLIRAYHQAQPKEKLLILGEGPEQSALQQLITELGLEDRVILTGFVDNPYPIMSRARYAVFSSLAEGFPNAMAEAMALSLPVIASDCDSGPAEILHNVIHVGSGTAFKADFGILIPVNDLDAMVQALQWMSDETLHNHYRNKSLERISDFGIERAVSKYFMALSPQS